MSLYLIERIDWESGNTNGFVVRAHTERKARELVTADHCGDDETTFLLPEKSTCTRLLIHGEPTIIMIDQDQL